MSYADLDLASWRRLGGVAAQRLAERIADTAGADLVEVRPHQYVGRPGRIALYRRDETLHALVPGGEVVLGYDGAWFTPTGGRVRQPRCRGRGPGDAWPAAAQPRGVGARLRRWRDDAVSLGEDCPTDCYPTQRRDGPHRLANAVGLVIGHDPYRAECTADPAVDCGGDGGRAICGSHGCFLGWVTLATAYRDRFYDVWPGSDHEVQNWADEPSQLFVRPVIELG